jgi:beta-glucosidase
VRFGVTFTDYDTLERTPKKSALLLKQMLNERIQAAVEHNQDLPRDAPA